MSEKIRCVSWGRGKGRRLKLTSGLHKHVHKKKKQNPQTRTHTYAKKEKQEQAKMGLHTGMQVGVLARKAFAVRAPLAGLLPLY